MSDVADEARRGLQVLLFEVAELPAQFLAEVKAQ